MWAGSQKFWVALIRAGCALSGMFVGGWVNTHDSVLSMTHHVLNLINPVIEEMMQYGSVDGLKYDLLPAAQIKYLHPIDKLNAL